MYHPINIPFLVIIILIFSPITSSAINYEYGANIGDIATFTLIENSLDYQGDFRSNPRHLGENGSLTIEVGNSFDVTIIALPNATSEEIKILLDNNTLQVFKTTEINSFFISNLEFKSITTLWYNSVNMQTNIINLGGTFTFEEINSSSEIGYSFYQSFPLQDGSGNSKANITVTFNKKTGFLNNYYYSLESPVSKTVIHFSRVFTFIDNITKFPLNLLFLTPFIIVIPLIIRKIKK